MPSGNDALALLCPDWRPPTLVYDAGADVVAYSNWPCLDMFARGEPAQLLGDRLSFGSAVVDRRFRACIQDAREQGRETSGFLARGGGDWFSVTVHNPQGFARDALARCVVGKERQNLVVVEVRTRRARLEDSTLESVRRSLDLTADESVAAGLLAAGSSFEDIGRRMGISPQHCGRIASSLLGKAECGSLHELLWLLLVLCPVRAEASLHSTP